MSRIGNKPVKIENGVKIEISGKSVKVVGPKGTLAFTVPWDIEIAQKDDSIEVTRKNESKQAKSDHGTVRAILANMIAGVTNGFKKELELVGMGYRARVEGRTLVMNLGWINPVKIEFPEDLVVAVRDDVMIDISGADKQKVGLWAAKVRSVKKPEPYKGKGIKYVDEVIRRKTSKTVKEA